MTVCSGDKGKKQSSKKKVKKEVDPRSEGSTGKVSKDSKLKKTKVSNSKGGPKPRHLEPNVDVEAAAPAVHQESEVEDGAVVESPKMSEAGRRRTHHRNGSAGGCTPGLSGLGGMTASTKEFLRLENQIKHEVAAGIDDDSEEDWNEEVSTYERPECLDLTYNSNSNRKPLQPMKNVDNVQVHMQQKESGFDGQQRPPRHTKQQYAHGNNHLAEPRQKALLPVPITPSQHSNNTSYGKQE